MPERTFLLRVEAVNLNWFIEDSQDLSTIRGGSLLLLDTPNLIEKKNLLANAGALLVDLFTKGASQAIFGFQASGLKEAQEIAAKLDQSLRQDGNYRHATFVIDVVKATDSLQADRERLLSLNRFRQMRQTRVLPSAWNEKPTPADDWPYCGIDLVRPASEDNHARNDGRRRISESVFVRAEYGRLQKQHFYKPYLPVNWPEARRFAQHFHEIGAAPPRECHNLKEKIAVIYVDGNKFGEQQRACNSKGDQRKFDDLVQEQLRGRALRALLNRVHTDQSWRSPGKDGKEVARLETLLWGGDELIWVVPAWEGWETVRLFFDEIAAHYGEQPKSIETAARPSTPARSANVGAVRNLNAPKKKVQPQGAVTPPAAPPLSFGRLTHAAGIVFCHAKSPIHRISSLAKRLAEQAKEKVKRGKDALAYMVLESFDHLEEDLQQARNQSLPHGCAAQDLVIPASDLAGLTSDIQEMKGKFPHGAIYRLLRELRSRPAADDGGRNRKDFRWWLERAEREGMEENHVPSRFFGVERNTKTNRRPPASNAANWIHLAELWDYIPRAE